MERKREKERERERKREKERERVIKRGELFITKTALIMKIPISLDPQAPQVRKYGKGTI